MYDKGHIIVKREIKNWGWYSNSKVFTVFVHLLIEANWKEANWEGQVIKRGEIVTSINEIATMCGLSMQEVRTCMKILGASGEVLSRRVGRRSILTICNYDAYQDDQQDSNKVLTSSQQDDNKSATSQQPSIIEQGNNAIKEEGKKEIDIQGGEDSGDKPKKKNKVFVKPTLKEIADYCETEHIPVDPSYFYDYYESNGWLIGKAPMKDWKATIRNWGRRRADQGQQGLFQEHDDATEEEKANWLNGRRPQKV